MNRKAAQNTGFAGLYLRTSSQVPAKHGFVRISLKGKKGFLGVSIVDIWVYTVFILLIIGFFAGFKLAKPTTIKSQEMQLPGIGGYLQAFLETPQEIEGKKLRTKEIVPFLLKNPDDENYISKIRASLNKLESQTKLSYALCWRSIKEEFECIYSKDYFESEKVAPTGEDLGELTGRGALISSFALLIEKPVSFHFVINPLK